MKNNMFLNGPKFEQIRAFTQFQVMNDGKAPEELLYSWEEAERKLLKSTSREHFVSLVYLMHYDAFFYVFFLTFL
jgi:hypothetical protein